MSQPTIRISKIKIRRGTDDQRKFQIFDQGELMHTIDTKRLYVGTGILSGGVVVGSKVHPPLTNTYSLSNVKAELGDLVHANNKYFQLIAQDYTNINSWKDVSPTLNSTVFNYNTSNSIDLNVDSISAKYIKSSTVSNGLKIENGILQTNLNSKSLEVSAFQVSLKAGGIDEREIASSTLGKGLTGGSGVKFTLDVDPYYFNYNSNTLSLSNTSNVDGVSLIKDINNTISLNTNVLSGVNEWPRITVDAFGRVIDQQSSIFGTLTANSALSGFNSGNSLSSIFNGSPNQALSGAIPGLTLTNFTGTDRNGNVITLSSAGFITFEGNTTTRSGDYVGRFAIPIFSF